MPKRNELDRNLLHILQCFLEDSGKQKFGRSWYYCLKPTDFVFHKKVKIVKIGNGRTLEFPASTPSTEMVPVMLSYRKSKLDPQKPDSWPEDEKDIIVSRKIFSTHVDYLLKFKLITKIETRRKNNKKKAKSKFYTITPWGICYLLKHADYVSPELTEKIYEILEMFATKYVKPYSSEIFHDKKIDFSNFYSKLVGEKSERTYLKKGMVKGENGMPSRYDVLKDENGMPIREKFVQASIFDKKCQLIISDFDVNMLSWSVVFWVNMLGVLEIKIRFMNFFNLGGDNILFQEPEKNNTDTPSRIPPIELDEDQFHNYLARFLLCYTIFFIVQQWDEQLSYAIQHTLKDAAKIRRNANIENQLEGFKKIKDLPDDFLKCVTVFTDILFPLANSIGYRWMNFQSDISEAKKKGYPGFQYAPDNPPKLKRDVMKEIFKE